LVTLRSYEKFKVKIKRWQTAFFLLKRILTEKEVSLKPLSTETRLLDRFRTFFRRTGHYERMKEPFELFSNVKDRSFGEESLPMNEM